MSNLDKMIEAGIFPAGYDQYLSSEEIQVLERMTPEEVETWIKYNKELHQANPDFTNEHASHNILY